jgi:cobalt/nickel transport protein
MAGLIGSRRRLSLVNIVMRPFVRLLAWAVLLGVAPPGSAHFNMLLPDKPSAKKGDEVVVTYQWGHPFEHQLFDAQAPESVIVRFPDGKSSNLTKELTKVQTPAGEKKTVVAYTLTFTPNQRGDHVFLLKTAPIWMEEDKEFLQDTVRVVVHVQAQKGWDRRSSHHGIDITPLTRPYGLQPGMVFQAILENHQLDPKNEALGDALVEIERYHAKPPKELPPDEQMTRTAKTDPKGVVTCTLTEPGWWCIAGHRVEGEKEHDGKKYPVRQRAIHWVYVDEAPVKAPFKD